MGNRVVLYLRLSKEDVDKVNEGDDSASIKNQRLVLCQDLVQVKMRFSSS